MSASVAKVKGIEQLTKPQLAALAAAAQAIGIDVDWLATVISFESAGSFSPSKPNAAGSGAFGLIQFLPSTAAGLLGYPQTEAGKAAAVAAGKAMSFEEQLKRMVVPYLKGPKYRNLDDVYLKILYPAAIGKAPDAPIFTAPSKAYDQNKGFDHDGKGYVTVSDVTSRIGNVLRAALSEPRVAIAAAAAASIVPLLVLGGLGAFLLTRAKG